MKYYIFSRYRQAISLSWIEDELKHQPHYKFFNTLRAAENAYTNIWKKGGLDFMDSDYDIFGIDELGNWYRFFTGCYNGDFEHTAQKMRIEKV